MKKIAIFLCGVFLLCLFAGCGGNAKDSASSEPGGKSPSGSSIAGESNSNAEPLSIQEFEALFDGQPVIFVSPPCIMEDTGPIKSTHLDIKIKNNTETDIRDVKVGIVMWKNDNTPIKIGYGSTDEVYFYSGSESNINLLPGSAHEVKLNTPGMYDLDTIVKAIVVSYTDYNGNTWNNPYLSTFRNAYQGKKYDENMTIELK